MYLRHFGLRQAPFALTPNTDFYYNLANHHEALNTLLLALRSGEGFIKITGEVGTGKTLLCRRLMNAVGPRFVVAHISNPALSPRELRQALAEELGLELPAGVDQHHLLKYITQVLVDIKRQGKRAVLIVDEAQALPDTTLESLRLLTNLETESAKLLQVVLFGQPELDARLARPSLRQLRQRITFSHRLLPLPRGATAGYVAHRMAVAGYAGEPIFTPGAISAIHRASRGTPRLVNILCHKSLMCGYGQGMRSIRPAHVRRAVSDTEGAVSPTSHAARWSQRAGMLLLVGGSLLALLRVAGL